MFFTEKNRKKNLIVFFLALPLFCGAIFLLQTHGVNAQDENAAMSGFSATAVGETTRDTGGGGSLIGDAFDLVFKGILLGIFTMLGWMASVAITLFEWVIKPENVSGAQGLLNQSVVYEMWKFIRDFFNLFFILVLLYIAFMVVFQIEKNFKKTLLSLVLAALFINFSFPVSRALIDVTNVPMYFFANQMAAGNGLSPGEGGGYTSVFSSAMSASKIKGILIPGAENGGSVVLLNPQNTYGRFLVAIVFMFLFSVTLLVLAVMFVIRLVALVILVIFSAVGFAASIVPGLSSYSKMWWESFWKYTFFGPAAMLMLLVSTRFFSALGDERTGIFKNLTSTATGNVSADPTFFASMALFSIPIIMLWMAMGLAQTFSIAGASSVVGVGKKFSTWVGKLPQRGMAAGFRSTGIPGGVKKAWQQKVTDRFAAVQSRREAKIATGLGVKGAKIQNIKSRAEEYKKQHLTKDDLKQKAEKGDMAAAYQLAQEGKMDHETYATIEPKIRGDQAVKDLLDDEIKKKRIDVLINAEMNSPATAARAAAVGLPAAQKEVAEKHLNKLDPSKWREQDLQKMFHYDDGSPDGVKVHIDAAGNVVDTARRTAYAAGDIKAQEVKARINAAQDIYGRYTPKNQDKTVDDMNGEKFAAGRATGIW